MLVSHCPLSLHGLQSHFIVKSELIFTVSLEESLQCGKSPELKFVPSRASSNGLFTILIVATVSQIHISKHTKFVKFSTLNMFSLLYVNGTSVQLFKKRIGASFTT